MILTLILVFTLLPVSFISASPGNLVTNGDFSAGDSNWDWQRAQFDNPPGVARIRSSDTEWAVVYQEISTSNKNLRFSFEINPSKYIGNGGIEAGITLFKNG